MAFAETLPGKVLLLAAFTAGLYLTNFDYWQQRALVLAVIVALPIAARPYLLVGGMLYILCLGAIDEMDWGIVDVVAAGSAVEPWVGRLWFRAATLACVGLLGWAFYTAARAGRDRWPLRRPIATMLVTFMIGLCTASYLPLDRVSRAILWSALVVAGRYLWYFAYSLADVRSPRTPPLGLQLGYYRSFWVGWEGTVTPYGKGAAYLRKVTARDPAELAVTRLKAVKLVYWALVLTWAYHAFTNFVHGERYGWFGSHDLPVHLALPRLEDALEHSFDGHPFAWHLNLLVVVAEFGRRLFELSIWGHIMIAILRMAGFRALRNTWRPLESQTIAEFWNRYYFYFKELLVEFFFYPTYLRYFKKYPRLRTFTATVVAAGFGNVVYHYLNDLGEIAGDGVWASCLSFRVYWLYGLVLSVAIGISQLRHGGRRPSYGPLRRVAASCGVLLFYCLLSVLDVPDRSRGVGEYLRFFVDLLPLR